MQQSHPRQIVFNGTVTSIYGQFAETVNRDLDIVHEQVSIVFADGRGGATIITPPGEFKVCDKIQFIAVREGHKHECN